MAHEIIDLASAPQRPGHAPLAHEGMDWRDRRTATEARAIVGKLLAWSQQFPHPEARALNSAIRDVDRCFMTVGTEIDEALTRLSLIESDPANAAEHLAIAKQYLHRWQDRGGRIGNVQ